MEIDIDSSNEDIQKAIHDIEGEVEKISYQRDALDAKEGYLRATLSYYVSLQSMHETNYYRKTTEQKCDTER